MAIAVRAAYSCNNVIKAGGLVAETESLLAVWDDALSVQANLAQALRENRLGKGSRARLGAVISVLRRRYLADPYVLQSLRALVRSRWPREWLRTVLYFHTAQAEPLIHDVVAEVLVPLRARGRQELAPRDVVAPVTQWVREGKTAARWSEYTTQRASEGVLTTLRDFGVLEGSAIKRFAPLHLPPAPFAYIAFALHLEAPSGQRVLHHPAWRLFFLDPEAVERLLIEAHQEHLLEYRAAGSITRLEFPATTLPEYAHGLAERAH